MPFPEWTTRHTKKQKGRPCGRPFSTVAIILVRMRRLLLPLLPLSVAVGMGMVVRMPFCLRVSVKPEVGVMTVRMSVVVVVVVSMRCRCIGRLLEAALFADFLGPSNGVVKLAALACGVRGKTFDRILIHMAGQRDLRVLHAQGAWITRVLARGRHRVIGSPLTP